MNRRQFLASMALPAKPARRPNVIMFMTDDHGAWATGAYGCGEMLTPNIDKLAREGARFTRAFACTPVCSPSRMTYMTGRLPSTHGVQDWIVPEDSYGPKATRWLDGHPTYTEAIAKSGYTMGMVGKWHMGDDDKAQRGFTYWASVPGGGGTYENPTFIKNGERIDYKGYKTDAVGDFSIEFLNQQTKDKPFYLLVPFYAPHTPFNYQPEVYREPFKDAKFSCFPDTPKHMWQNRGLAAHHGNRASKLAYSALINGMDHNVGRILKRLAELGMREDTLVIFTADQGWNAGHHGVWGKGNGTWPFNMYEESLRVPLIWNHPGHIPAGITPNPMVSSYDYFPTILDYLGIKTPTDPKRVGRSYAAFVKGQSPRWQNRLYFEYSYVRGVRTETLKYVERTKEWPSELYDLEADPGETKNVIDDPAHQKQFETLRTDLARYFQKNGAPPIEDWRKTTKQNLSKYSN
jgi:choline-sulfatase